MFNSNRCYQLGSLVLAAIQKGGKLFIKRNPTNRILRVCHWILKGNYKAKLGRSGWIQQNYEIEIHGPSGENVNEKKITEKRWITLMNRSLSLVIAGKEEEKCSGESAVRSAIQRGGSKGFRETETIILLGFPFENIAFFWGDFKYLLIYIYLEFTWKSPWKSLLINSFGNLEKKFI